MRFIIIALVLLFASPVFAQQAASTDKTDRLNRVYNSVGVTTNVTTCGPQQGTCHFASNILANSYEFVVGCLATVILNENSGGTGDNLAAIEVWRVYTPGGGVNASVLDSTTAIDGTNLPLTKGTFFIRVSDAPTVNNAIATIEFRGCAS